jgi:hypothetical protein
MESPSKTEDDKKKEVDPCAKATTCQQCVATIVEDDDTKTCVWKIDEVTGKLACGIVPKSEAPKEGDMCAESPAKEDTSSEAADSAKNATSSPSTTSIPVIDHGDETGGGGHGFSIFLILCSFCAACWVLRVKMRDNVDFRSAVHRAAGEAASKLGIAMGAAYSAVASRAGGGSTTTTTTLRAGSSSVYEK